MDRHRFRPYACTMTCKHFTLVHLFGFELCGRPCFPSCATWSSRRTSSRASCGSSPCTRTASTASWPTRWDWARRCVCPLPWHGAPTNWDDDCQRLGPSTASPGRHRLRSLSAFVCWFALLLRGCSAAQVQTIGFLSHLKKQGLRGPYIVVGPLSTLPNWINEFQRFMPSMPLLLYHGSKKEREELRRTRLKLGECWRERGGAAAPASGSLSSRGGVGPPHAPQARWRVYRRERRVRRTLPPRRSRGAAAAR